MTHYLSEMSKTWCCHYKEPLMPLLIIWRKWTLRDLVASWSVLRSCGVTWLSSCKPGLWFTFLSFVVVHCGRHCVTFERYVFAGKGVGAPGTSYKGRFWQTGALTARGTADWVTLPKTGQLCDTSGKKSNFVCKKICAKCTKRCINSRCFFVLFFVLNQQEPRKPVLEG